MAVGTVLLASYWSAWTAREVAIEQDKLLKVPQLFSKSIYYFTWVSPWVLRTWYFLNSWRTLLHLQDGSDELLQMEATGSSGYIDINTTAAILFVVIASCFLVMLYKLMSAWFLDVLVVLFCIGGAEVCPFFPLFWIFRWTTCFVSIKNCLWNLVDVMMSKIESIYIIHQ